MITQVLFVHGMSSALNEDLNKAKFKLEAQCDRVMMEQKWAILTAQTDVFLNVKMCNKAAVIYVNLSIYRSNNVMMVIKVVLKWLQPIFHLH